MLFETKTKSIKDESGWKEYVKSPELMDYTSAAGKGYAKGSALANKHRILLVVVVALVLMASRPVPEWEYPEILLQLKVPARMEA